MAFATAALGSAGEMVGIDATGPSNVYIAGVIVPRGRYGARDDAAFANSPLDPNFDIGDGTNQSWFKEYGQGAMSGDAGVTVPLRDERYGRLFNAIMLQAQSSPLGVCSGTLGIAGSDTGAFTTLAPGVANTHSLPANFGKGRGQWVADDVAHLRVHLEDRTTDCLGAAAGSLMVVQSIVFTPTNTGVVVLYPGGPDLGDITITIGNTGFTAVATLSAFRITLEHTIQH